MYQKTRLDWCVNHVEQVRYCCLLKDAKPLLCQIRMQKYKKIKVLFASKALGKFAGDENTLIGGR
jgi:hypothetical protein